jgi:hypothetical protein
MYKLIAEEQEEEERTRFIEVHPFSRHNFSVPHKIKI